MEGEKKHSSLVSGYLVIFYVVLFWLTDEVMMC